MNHVIIGNSSAAIACIEAIRKSGNNDNITIISKEPYSAYSRPIISYLLAKTADEHKIWYRSSDFYEKNNVTLILGKKAEKIDSQNKKVLIEGGKEISFDKLLIATGGIPFVPEIKGIIKDNDRIFTFTQWSDAQKLMQIKNDLNSVVVIGAGMIGTKAVEALTLRGIKVTLVELAGSVLPKALDSDSSKIVENQMKKKGVNVILNNEVTEIKQDNQKISHVILRDNQKIDCDAVIIAIGVIPNVQITQGADIKINRGILVNDHMETSVTDIYAAGDVAEADEMLFGGKTPIPIWPLANNQGAVAGLNMAAQETTYDPGFSMNAIEFCGVSTISYGITDVNEDEYEIIKKSDIKNKTYKKLIIKDNKIVGAIFVGEVEKAGMIRNLIKTGFDVSKIKNDLISDDFGFISFSRDFRQEYLEKAV